jgi:hypothetical protein
MVRWVLLCLGIVGQRTMCLLVGSVDIARLKVAGAVRAMSLWHWKESIVLVGARIVDMLCDGRVYSYGVCEPRCCISRKLT